MLRIISEQEICLKVEKNEIPVMSETHWSKPCTQLTFGTTVCFKGCQTSNVWGKTRHFWHPIITCFLSRLCPCLKIWCNWQYLIGFIIASQWSNSTLLLIMFLIITRGEGDSQQSFVLGGTALKSNFLPFCTVFDRKGTTFAYLLLTNDTLCPYIRSLECNISRLTWNQVYSSFNFNSYWK